MSFHINVISNLKWRLNHIKYHSWLMLFEMSQMTFRMWNDIYRVSTETFILMVKSLKPLYFSERETFLSFKLVYFQLKSRIANIKKIFLIIKPLFQKPKTFKKPLFLEIWVDTLYLESHKISFLISMSTATDNTNDDDNNKA